MFKKNYIRYRLLGGADKTVFIGEYKPIVEQHLRELLKDRNFTITKKWSIKSGKHLILNKTPVTINWKTIEKECRLLNHMPFSEVITNKKKLADLLQLNPHLFKYYPYSFNDDINKHLELYNDYKTDNFGDKLWMVKPGGTWGGVGIKLMKLEDLYKIRSKKVMYQKYLEKPLLLNGYKFDFRMYVLFTPDKKLFIHPFYEVRIAHAKYNLKIKTMDAHLTNLSYQEAKGYNIKNKRMTKDKFEKVFKKDLQIVEKVGEIMVKTFDMIKDHIDAVKSDNYFELYGVDVIFDVDLNPYIIEFNNNPGFSLGGTDYDKHHSLLNQVYNLTIDKVFDGKDVKTDFIKLKQY